MGLHKWAGNVFALILSCTCCFAWVLLWLMAQMLRFPVDSQLAFF